MGMFDFVSEAFSAPGDWLGQGMEWLGERTGIGPLANAGEWLSNDQNAWAQQLATTAMLGGAGYGAMNYMFPEGMFFGDPSAMLGAKTAADASTAGSSMLDIGAGGYMDAGASGANAGFNPVAGAEMTAPTTLGGMNTTTVEPWMGNTADFASFAEGGANASTPGVLDMVKNGASGAWESLPTMAKWAIPTGMAANLASGYLQKGAMGDMENQMNRYLSDASWDDTKRANTMKGIMGQINEMVTGAKRRAASSGADLGRGGGFYGNKANQALQAGREQAAKALATTYGPTNANPGAYQALATAQGFNPWQNFASGIGNTAGKWPYLFLLDSLK